MSQSESLFTEHSSPLYPAVTAATASDIMTINVSTIYKNRLKGGFNPEVIVSPTFCRLSTVFLGAAVSSLYSCMRRTLSIQNIGLEI